MKVVDAKALLKFKLLVRFDDGVSGEIDLSELAGRGVFAAWLQPEIFAQVRVTDSGAVEWPGEIDLCPDSLYLRLTGKAPEEIFPALQGRVTHA